MVSDCSTGKPGKSEASTANILGPGMLMRGPRKKDEAYAASVVMAGDQPGYRVDTNCTIKRSDATA